jgi:hypothetical protein
MRKKLALLGLAIAGAIGLSTFATGLPASAAPATSITASAHTANAQGLGTVTPDAIGKVVCGAPTVCIQRTTEIINNKANVRAWANTVSFTGHFELVGPNGHIANSTVQHWVAGGGGWTFQGVAKGAQYSVIAWGPGNVGHTNFSV